MVTQAQIEHAQNKALLNTHTHQTGLVGSTPGAADKSILLVDLSAATAAEWTHSTGNAVVLHWIKLLVDRGSFTGEIYLGWVRENDGTNGTIYIIRKWDPAADIEETIDFGDSPWICSLNHQLYPVSGDYTVLQDDANYGVQVNGTATTPAVGDLVFVYDYAGAAVTALDCIVKYSII